MASYTGNLNLKKPALDDDALITDINNNMDILDAAVNGIQDGLAIVANGNTHVAITSGQFVYVRNHGTLTEGLYVASTNIAANATLSSSNLTADAAGGLNALNSKLSHHYTAPPNNDISSPDLFGVYFSQDNISNLPTYNTNVYYFIVCLANTQIALRYSSDGITRTFVRGYINTQWYSWRQITGGSYWLPSGTNLNNILTTGCFGISGDNSYTGLPTGVTAGVLNVINPSVQDTYCMQILYAGSSAMYVRYRSFDSGTSFGSWYKYTGTAV